MSKFTKTILITGASGGIGSAIALEFAERFLGQSVSLILLAFKNAEKLNKITKIIKNKYECKAEGFIGDISDSDAVNELFSRIPPIDILINCAGIAHHGLIQDMSTAEWRNVLDTNLSSVFYMVKAALPHMLAQKCGKIINISSVWGNVGASMETAYAAAKGGLNIFTKSLAKELAPSNISVNAIACGFIDTDMNANLSEEEKAALISEIPANRAGTPKEVARLAVMLATAPSYLTGQVIGLDGGWT